MEPSPFAESIGDMSYISLGPLKLIQENQMTDLDGFTIIYHWKVGIWWNYMGMLNVNLNHLKVQKTRQDTLFAPCTLHGAERTVREVLAPWGTMCRRGQRCRSTRWHSMFLMLGRWCRWAGVIGWWIDGRILIKSRGFLSFLPSSGRWFNKGCKDHGQKNEVMWYLCDTHLFRGMNGIICFINFYAWTMLMCC